MSTDPFSSQPQVSFYVPSTSVAADHAPSATLAAVLASMDFATKGN